MLCVAELVTLGNMAIASLVTLCPNELYAKQILQTRETCWKFYKNRKQNSNLHKHEIFKHKKSIFHTTVKLASCLCK